ncbi:MAG: AarF/UbiB family protein [Myxococcota bacterium]|nr:AarF/UbiB family protein [Myxococcota bacterium]
MSKKPTSSRLGRLAALGGMTTRVSAEYLGQRLAGVFQDDESRAGGLRAAHIRNAEKIVETMGRLKGAAMKVGQTVAVMADGAGLPPEVASILSRLHDKAPPVSFEVIQEDIESELGAPISELFSEFEPEPLGSASLGQAHVARLENGQEVVVKVLHRGISGSVDSDLMALRSILTASRILQRDKEELDAVFSEIRERLEEELDYRQEALNIETFSDMLSDLDGVRVPKMVSTHSTERVLTMERLSGEPLEDFLALGDAQACQKAGENLATLFQEMFYRHRTLHCDPHPGNYLFEADGTLGLLDYGCVRRFEPEFVARYAQIGRAAVLSQREEALRLAHEMGCLDGAPPEAESLLWQFFEVIAIPFQGGAYRAGSSEDSVQASLQELAPNFVRYPQIKSPPELVYLHRSLMGVYAMLRQLQTELDYGELHRIYVEHAVGVWEGRIEDGSAIVA